MMNTDILKSITPEAFLAIFAKAVEVGMIESKTPEPHWYPCGFAWLAIRIRKNHRLAKTLIGLGFRWDDYDKSYQTSLYNTIPCAYSEMSQSMDYRARILNSVASVLQSEGMPFNVRTRID